MSEKPEAQTVAAQVSAALERSANLYAALALHTNIPRVERICRLGAAKAQARAARVRGIGFRSPGPNDR